MHVVEYLTDAARNVVEPEKSIGWAMERKRRMLAGEYEKILTELTEHECDSHCAKNESGKCLVQVAQTYLENNGRYMKDYADFMVSNLPVGSGEAAFWRRATRRRRGAERPQAGKPGPLGRYNRR